jgi:glycosyltransferase involved in cell wall biosynthesis
MRPKISIGITVCNEVKELEALLSHLDDRALPPEYEIVIQIDKDNYDREILNSVIDRGIKHYFFPLNKDFASYKNELIKHCIGEFIFCIDADELVPNELLELLPEILEGNPGVDLYLLPRINTVEGITQEDILKWGWRYENGRINYPDFQSRIFRNSPNIRWRNAVHEVIEGHKQFSVLPMEDRFSIIHHKSIEKQTKQNQFYNTI